MKRALGVIAMAAAFAACSGKAVVDGGQGGASSTSSSTAGSSTTSTGSVGPSSCDDHADCPDGVCVFATGRCATTCGDSCNPCGPGLICDPCATSSCPTCFDCRAACVPATPGSCDDHDDCGDQQVCLYASGECAPTCESPECADPNMVCADCVTASCPCCTDCGSACLPAPP